VTPRTDVYGLALVAYELLTGQPAFAGADNEDLLRDRLERGAPHIRSADARLSLTADGVIAKGLARDPERRYPTAGAFALALSDAVNDPVTRVLRPIIASSARRWPRLDTLLALGVVLAILVAVVLFFARFPSAPFGGVTDGHPTAPTSTSAGHLAPNVVGRDVNDAANALIAAGYRAPIPWTMDPQAKGTACSVVSQQPAAGTSVQPGSAASLVIVSGDCAKK